MISKETKVLIVAVLAAILAFGVFNWGFFGFFKNGEDGARLEETPTPKAEETSVPGSSLSNKTYTDLVKQYEGKRIQFDQNCQMIPPDLTFKNRTTLMFDNRSPISRTILIAGQAHFFPGYGYKILTLQSPILPATLVFGCDDIPAIGKILLQQ